MDVTALAYGIRCSPTWPGHFGLASLAKSAAPNAIMDVCRAIPAQSHSHISARQLPSRCNARGGLTEQKVHSHRAHSATITRIRILRISARRSCFSHPNSSDASTWTTVGVWFVWMTCHQEDGLGEREPGRERTPHRATTPVCS